MITSNINMTNASNDEEVFNLFMFIINVYRAYLSPWASCFKLSTISMQVIKVITTIMHLPPSHLLKKSRLRTKLNLIGKEVPFKNTYPISSHLFSIPTNLGTTFQAPVELNSTNFLHPRACLVLPIQTDLLLEMNMLQSTRANSLSRKTQLLSSLPWSLLCWRCMRRSQYWILRMETCINLRFPP